MTRPLVSHLARTRQFDASEIALRRRLGQRLPGLYDVNPKHFEGLVAGFCIVNCTFRDLVGFACLDFHRGLAIDQKLKLALEHVAGFGARMSMAACGPAGGNLRNRGDGVVAGREIELCSGVRLMPVCCAMATPAPATATTVSPSRSFLIMRFLPVVEKV